ASCDSRTFGGGGRLLAGDTVAAVQGCCVTTRPCSQRDRNRAITGHPTLRPCWCGRVTPAPLTLLRAWPPDASPGSTRRCLADKRIMRTANRVATLCELVLPRPTRLQRCGE